MTRSLIATAMTALILYAPAAQATGYIKIDGVKGEALTSPQDDTQTTRQQNRRVEFKPVFN